MVDRLRPIIIVTALLIGGVGIYKLCLILQCVRDCRRDSVQEYVFAKAFETGMNPYTPINELSEKFNVVDAKMFKHPSPHTPIVGVFSLPLAYLSFQSTIILWLIIELAFLVAAVFLLLPELSIKWKLLIAFSILGWYPVLMDLGAGQINFLLLLFIVGTLRLANSSHRYLTGMLLGLAVAIKLIYYPLILFMLLRKRWKESAAAMTVFGIAQALSALVFGWQTVIDYYRQVAPAVAEKYKTGVSNLSLWSIGWKLFPDSEAAGKFAAYVLAFAALVAGLTLAYKAADFETGFSIALCTCLVVSPIVWEHYLVLLLIPISLVWQRLKDRNFPRPELLMAGYVLLPQLISSEIIENFLTGRLVNDQLPPGLILITGIHAAAIIALAVFLYRLRLQKPAIACPIELSYGRL